MQLRYLIDSTILIDHFNGIPQATDWLSGLEYGEAAISVITRAEVLVLIHSEDEKEAVKLFLDDYLCLPIDVPTADLASELRRQWKWKLPDAFQAALADQHNLVLVTRDKKDFGRTSQPVVKIPYKL